MSLTPNDIKTLKTILASGGYDDRLLHSGKKANAHPARKAEVARLRAVGMVEVTELVRHGVRVTHWFVTAAGCVAVASA